MRLPSPSPEQIESFKVLYERKFSVTLTSTEAADVSTRFLQLYFLFTYAIHSVRQEE